MGSQEAKAKLKLHLSKLIDRKTDLSDESQYWSLFWAIPTSMDDISSIFLPADIRYLRDNNIQIFTKLIFVITRRLIYLSKLINIKISQSLINQLMNCIRLLTVILPFLREKKQLAYVEDELFWNKKYHTPIYQYDNYLSDIVTINEDKFNYDSSSSNNNYSVDDSPTINHNKVINNEKLIGIELINSCLDLLLISDFTVENNFKSNSDLPISWEPGFEVPGLYKNPLLKLDSNRLEIIRFMLVLFSNNLYTTVPEIVNSSSRFLTILVSSTDGKKFYFLCLSLLNLIIRSLQLNSSIKKENDHIDTNLDNNNGLEILNEDHKKLRILMVTNALQLFTLMIVYAIPKKDILFLFTNNIILNNDPVRNRTRLFLNRILNPKDIRLIIKSLTSPLFKPIIDNDMGTLSYLMKSSKLIEDNDIHLWSSELMIIILELYQCNAKFRVHFAELIGADYFVLLIYYILKFKNEKKYSSFIKLVIFNMLFLSGDLRLGLKLLTPFNMDFYESMPQILRISTTPTSYRDFLVIHICNIIGSSSSPNSYMLQIIQILYNLIALHVMIFEYNKKENREILGKRRLSIKDLSKCPPSQLSYAASTSIIQIIVKFSNLSYFYNNTDKHSDYLSLILRACCHAIIRDPSNSIVLLYVFSKNNSTFSKLDDIIKKISDDLYTDLLQKEKKEYDLFIHNQQIHLQQQILQSQESNINASDQDFTQFDESKESLDLSLSRQNTQNTLESIPSIRSTLTLTRQTSQISISHGSPKITTTTIDDSIDPFTLSLQNNKNDTQNEEFNNDNSISDDSKIILFDEELFKAEFPIGMTDKSKGKKPYYSKFNNKWIGNDSLKLLKKCITVINGAILLQSNIEIKNQPGNASIVIQKLMKLDLEGLIGKIDKPEMFEYDKCSYHPLKLKWNNIILGWYISIIWSDIYLNYNSYAAKGILAEISSGFSAIKKVSSSWSFGGWKLGSISDPLVASPSPLSNGFTLNPNEIKENNKNGNNNKIINDTIYYDNILKHGVWFGTHIQLFRVNPVLLKDHYTLQHGKSEIFNNSSSTNGIPVFTDVFRKRNSISSPILRTGSGVFTEGFWKRQGGRPISLDRRDSDGSLKLQLSRNGNGKGKQN
jgi:hypothetical protein